MSARRLLGRRVIAAIGVATVGVVAVAGPAWATAVSLVNQTQEGSLQIRPGDWLSAGYEFSLPGSHPADVVGFAGAVAQIPVSCASQGAQVGVITIDLNGGPWSVPAGDSNWLPGNNPNQAAPVTFEGAVQAPDLCAGGVMYSASNSPAPKGGANYSADIEATQTSPVASQFHFRDPNAKGDGNIDCANPSSNPYPANSGPCGASWAGAPQVDPTQTSTPLPVGAIGVFGLAVVLAAAFWRATVRHRPRPVPAAR